MKSEADSLKFYGGDISSNIGFKIREIEKVEFERVQAEKESERIYQEREKAKEQFKRSQLEAEERRQAEEQLSRRSVGQLKRYEGERTTRAFEGI